MTAHLVRREELDLARYVRSGDGVVWGQVTGEPLALSETLVEQRRQLGSVSVFLGVSFSNTVQPEHADTIRLLALGGAGTNRRLSKAGVLSVMPAHISSIPGLIAGGAIPSEVAMVQVTPSPLAGRYNFTVVSDYIVAAVEKARIVIGELNHAAPRVSCPHSIPAERFACLVETERPVIEVPNAQPSGIERAIARHAAEFVGDGCTLQIGIGAIPDAVLALLYDRHDLGIHSGSIGDGLVDLVEKGVVTNALKPFDRGRSVAGTLIGTQRLYSFANDNPSIQLQTIARTHSIDVLTALPNFISINSALEVDLTGQVNAEVAGGVHMGAVGGQVDFVRGALSSQGGRSIIALPATAASGNASRIVAQLSGPVTTSRSDVDVVVTEHGAAQLRGRTLEQRAQALIAIAAPEFREGLVAAARSQGLKG